MRYLFITFKNGCIRVIKCKSLEEAINKNDILNCYYTFCELNGNILKTGYLKGANYEQYEKNR